MENESKQSRLWSGAIVSFNINAPCHVTVRTVIFFYYHYCSSCANKCTQKRFYCYLCVLSTKSLRHNRETATAVLYIYTYTHFMHYGTTVADSKNRYPFSISNSPENAMHVMSLFYIYSYICTIYIYYRIGRLFCFVRVECAVC